MPLLTFNFFIFLFGSIIGSFLNVVIYRLKSTENGSLYIHREPFSVTPRSHCPKCGQILAWYDLIPIVSFFALAGRCRECKEKISWQYPAVELATGALFVAVYQFIGLSVGQFGVSGLGAPPLGGDINGLIFGLTLKGGLQIGYYWFIISSLIVIFVYDLRHYIIPDIVLFPAIGATLIYRIFDAFINNPTQPPLNLRGGEIPPLNLRGGEGELLLNSLMALWPYLLSALAATAFFLFLVLITRGRGMGIGDIKLVFLLGLLLGWPQILLALFLAFAGGALVGLALIAAGRKQMKSPIPFGPFLIAAALAALFWGQGIIDWYWGLMGV